MATTYTTNYHLGKQTDHSDKFDMDVITDNADKIDTALKENADAINNKQDTLNAAQLDAVNSGITSEDVAQIETNKNNISTDEAALVELVDGGAKNTFPPIIRTATTNGVSFVADGDGTITMNGTATNDAIFVISDSLSISAGDIIYGEGSIDGSVTNGWFMDLYDSDYTNRRKSLRFFEATENSKIWRLIVKSGATMNNVVFRYMICSNAAWDISHEYQPYRPSYQELYEQTETNKNNISSITNKIDEIGIVKTISPITPSAANTYECITASKITLPAGKILHITASCIFLSSYATGIAIVRGTTKENSKILALSESATDYNALSVSTVCSFGSDQDIYVFLKTNSTGTAKVVMVYDIIAP